MSITTFKQAAAALALALAAPAFAQVPRQAPAPPTPPQQATGQGALSKDQQVWIGAVWNFTQLEGGLGDVAAARGSAAEVKDFARKVGDEHRRFAGQLQTALQQRGVSPASLPQSSDLQQLTEEAKQLAARSGEEFDRALVGFMKSHGERFVDALKSARESTPGSDSALKKLLDEAEDAEEGYLTQARQLDARRVQARTPPGR